MTAGLYGDAAPRIDQGDGGVGARSTGRHIAGILLVSGNIGDDVFALRAREIAVGHIDRDALLALGDKAVGEQREIGDRAALALHVAFEIGALIDGDGIEIPQQTPDERAFAVVDATARNESKQFFAFMLFEISQNIRGYQFALMRHSLEVSLRLLEFHTCPAAVLVNHSPLPFGSGC